MFNPKESIDFNGNTGLLYNILMRVFSRYYVRPQTQGHHLCRRIHIFSSRKKEQNLIKLVAKLPDVVKEAGTTYSPALLANYAYDLAKEFNQFYHDFSILKEENEALRNFRLLLAKQCGEAIKNAMGMLGIEMPERM